MKTKSKYFAETTGAAAPCPSEDLLESVKEIRARVGESLDDEEFTFFLRQMHLPEESGFRFLCFHDGFVTLSVPHQDDESWRPRNKWISTEKEKIATGLAKKYKLLLSEPPDAALRWIVPCDVTIRHHIHFSNRRETIIIAHPEFLKIRLYSSQNGLVFPPAPGLLEDMAVLYDAELLPHLADEVEKRIASVPKDHKP